uniref:Uncharacterized protein n=1 Tax=Anopheles albimanus TaxID=7167 RepID=A0A182FG70_ANOAL
MEGALLDLSSPKKETSKMEAADELSSPLDLSTRKRKWKAEDPPSEPPAEHVEPTTFPGIDFNKCAELFSRVDSVLGTSEATVHPDLERSFLSIWDWKFVPVANPNPASRIFVLAIDGMHVYWSSTLQPGSPCKPFTEVPGLRLPGYTLLYAELVTELQGEGSQQTPHRALHVIDGIMLDSIVISQLSLYERHSRCEQFVASLGSPQLVRVKPLFELYHLQSFFGYTKEFRLWDGQRRPGCVVSNDVPVQFFVPHGLLFLRDTKPDIHRHRSKRWDKFYYYDERRKVSWFLEQPALATFEETFRVRTLWTWDFMISVNGSKAKVFRHELWAYIQSQLPGN